jgi:hypothetical protein
VSDGLAFVDTETTGLDPDRHEVWEVGLIIDGNEKLWHLPVDLGRADAIALRIGRFHDRYANEPNLMDKPFTRLTEFAEEFADLTRGRHLVGAVVSFDEERLRKLLRANGACPEWHYHLVDVEALVAGRLALAPPWDSEDLSVLAGVTPSEFDRHTALGDARWAKAIYENVMGLATG